jgi:hypothetical protein
MHYHALNALSALGTCLQRRWLSETVNQPLLAMRLFARVMSVIEGLVVLVLAIVVLFVATAILFGLLCGGFSLLGGRLDKGEARIWFWALFGSVFALVNGIQFWLYFYKKRPPVRRMGAREVSIPLALDLIWRGLKRNDNRGGLTSRGTE